MINLLPKDYSSMITCSRSECEKKMDFLWLDTLQFQTENVLSKVLRHSKKAMRKKELSIEEKWLGVHFQREISNGFLPKVSIRWIDEDFGYGVYAEEKIAIGSYIGEYTGIIRKRLGRKDRKNDYCFEYTIGDWARNPFIIDAQGQGNFTRFINHSEEPTLKTLSVYTNQLMHIIFIAEKPITKGMQLGYHYGDYFWKKRAKSKKIF